ncbi:hypothetical protein EB061_02985 [bacterium]|nr:hypothetical protein [bacterium]
MFFPGVRALPRILLLVSLLGPVSLFQASSPAWSANLSQDPVPIRPRMLECRTFLTPEGMSDGIGIPLSMGGVQEFETISRARPFT